MENELQRLAKKLRRIIVEMVYQGKEGHIGCSFSCIDILIALYFGNILRIDPKDPLNPRRDRFVMSKGHGAAALYSVLAERGFLRPELIKNFCQQGKNLAVHVSSDWPGVEVSTGSGGHGLSIAVGMALAAKYDKNDSKIFALVGDGECQEGSIWEAIMFAGHHHLDNLTLMVDDNNLQAFEETRQVINLDPFAKKFEDFGWKALTINGHDFDEILKAFRQSNDGKPKAIVARTIKGHGVKSMENDPIWHGYVPNENEYLLILEELNETRGQ